MMQNTIEVVVNGEDVTLPIDATISTLLSQLNIRSRAIAVEVNQQIQSSNRFEDIRLNQNDELEIVTLVGGG